MNDKTKRFKLDWKQIAIVVIVLGIAGYQWYTREFSADQPVVATGQTGTFSDDDYKVNFPADKGKSDSAENGAAKPKANSKPKSTGKPAGPYLKPAGGKNLKSPAGLIYTGGRSEHRADHVLRHAQDIPNRSEKHGVFDANGDDVFRLIDEAYELVKNDSSRVKTTSSSNGKTEYVIDMKRKIGYLGGKPGEQRNHPTLYKVKLVLGDNRVITAYPY